MESLFLKDSLEYAFRLAIKVEVARVRETLEAEISRFSSHVERLKELSSMAFSLEQQLFPSLHSNPWPVSEYRQPLRVFVEGVCKVSEAHAEFYLAERPRSFGHESLMEERMGDCERLSSVLSDPLLFGEFCRDIQDGAREERRVRRRVLGEESPPARAENLFAGIRFDGSLLAFTRRQIVSLACANFERCQLMAPGTVTLMQVQGTSLGLEGWARAIVPYATVVDPV
jgi:hypothetical protein